MKLFISILLTISYLYSSSKSDSIIYNMKKRDIEIRQLIQDANYKIKRLKRKINRLEKEIQELPCSQAKAATQYISMEIKDLENIKRGNKLSDNQLSLKYLLIVKQKLIRNKDKVCR